MGDLVAAVVFGSSANPMLDRRPLYLKPDKNLGAVSLKTR